jgi:hypothetical protein
MALTSKCGASASQMLGFLNLVLFMFGGALCAAQPVRTNIMRREGFSLISVFECQKAAKI